MGAFGRLVPPARGRVGPVEIRLQLFELVFESGDSAAGRTLARDAAAGETKYTFVIQCLV